MKIRIKRLLAVMLALILFTVQIYNMEFPADRFIARASGIPEAVCTYQFNNSQGTSEVVVRNGDTAEGSNSGTIPVTDTSTTVKYADGISGRGIYLDGTYGLKLYPGIDSPLYTISLWIKPEEERLYSDILYAGTGLLTDNEKCLNITSDDLASPVIISSSPDGGYYIGKDQAVKTGVWSNICISVKNNNASIYVNGKLQAAGNVPEGICNKDTSYYLGLDCYNVPFKGCIDNIAFYNTCLSDSQAEAVYNTGKNTAASGKVTGISLSETSLSLNGYGDTKALYASISPGNAENQGVIWKSSDRQTVSVNNGVVTALKNGNAVITAVTEDGGYKSECKVTAEGIKQAEGITLDKTSVLLEGDGSSGTLSVNAIPEGAHIPDIIWASSDENVVIADKDGNIFPVANGRADIKAQTEDGAFMAICHVTVQGVSKEVGVLSVEFTESLLELDNKNKKHQLNTIIKPESAANKECVYYSEDNSVAVVDDKGMVKATGNGKTNICVISNDGRYTASCQVHVSGFKDNTVKKLELDKESIEVARGETGYLYVNTTPVTADEVLDWRSNNPDAVEVVADEYGRSAEVIVYEDAVMGSTAMVTVSSETGASAECFVEVTEFGVKKIDMGNKNLYMLPGESYEMEADIVPREAENSELIWTSSNNNVAVVNERGVIKIPQKAKAGSKAIITSSNLARTKKSTCKITVKSKKVKIKKLSTKKRNISLYPGQKSSLPVKYIPANATDVKLEYTSKNPGIVKISKGGKISVPADYKGTAEVKVTARSGNGKKVSSIVKVKQREVKIKKLSMSKNVLDLYGGGNTTLYLAYKPLNATHSNIKWTSSDKNAVRVKGSGSRASVSAGNISSRKTITIKAKDVNGATASCRVSVYPKASVENNNPGGESSPGGGSSTPGSNSTGSQPSVQKIRKLSFGSNYIFVKRGKGKNLKTLLSISPSGAANDLIWKCSNKYASVNQNGYITISGKAQKNTNISVLVYSKSNSLVKASIIVNVTA